MKTLLGDLSGRDINVLLAELNWRRSQMELAKSEPERVTFLLMIDELEAELARRNAAVLADRAAKGMPS